MTEIQKSETGSSRVSMNDAAYMLAELCDRIEDGETIDHALIAVFHEVKLELAGAVDRRIAFDVWIKAAIEGSKKARDEWSARTQQLQSLHSAFKDNTRQIIVANPGLPYAGKLGQITVQKSPPKLTMAFDAKHITPDMIKYFEIPSAYVKTDVVYSLDTDAIKKDLAAGKELFWATLTQDSHVRFKK